MGSRHTGPTLGEVTRAAWWRVVGVMLGVVSAASASGQQTGTLVQWGAASLDQRQNAPAAAGPYTAIAAGPYFSMSIRADGWLVQWGSTSDRQTDNLPSAVGPYREIAAGASHGLALRSDGSQQRHKNIEQLRAENAALRARLDHIEQIVKAQSANH